MERLPGKIDSINPGISESLAEPYVSLHFQHNSSDEECWLLFRGEVNVNKAAATSPVKTTNGLIEMLCWIHLNGIVAEGTVVALYPDDVPVSPREIRELLSALRHHHPFGQPHSVGMKALSQPAYAVYCTLFINTGIDPMAHLSKAGKQLTSSRSNPLSFGSAHTCLVESVEALLVTSWGEVLITRHQGIDGLADYLCHYLQMTLHNRPGKEPPEVEAYGFSSIRATTTARRVAQLCNDICRNFGPNGEGPDSRYIYQAAESFYLLEKEGRGFVATSYSSVEELIDELGQTGNHFRALVVDSDTLQDTLLPTIFEYNQRGKIQLFYHCHNRELSLYILDEYGALFQQEIIGSSERQMLDQQQLFFNELMMLRSRRSEQYDQQQMLEQPEYYRVTRGRDGSWKATKRAMHKPRIGKEYLDLCLISEELELHGAPYMVICGKREFVSLEHGAETFREVARHIYDQRDAGETYPIYLTSLELSGSAPQHGWTTIELLNFKKRVETRLNQELADILAEE
jgi:adenylate cyclase class 1